MGVTITYDGTLPSLNNPSAFNEQALALFQWVTGTGSGQLLGELAAVDANDFFSVQSSATDTTSGRLMAVGAFGLGDDAPPVTAISVTDMDDLTIGGMWSLNGTLNKTPYGTSGEAGTCLVIRRAFASGPAVAQLANYLRSGEEQLWYRQGTGDPVIWGDWYRVPLDHPDDGMIVPSGRIKSGGSLLFSEEITIADDAVADIDLAPDRYGGWLLIGANMSTSFPRNNDFYVGLVDFGNSPSEASSIVKASSVTVETSDTLTGTTGADGNLTIGLAGDSGTFQVENRTGDSRTFSIALL